MTRNLTFEIITPDEHKESSFEICYGFHSTPFGNCFIGIIAGSICHLSFIDYDESLAIQILRNQWPKAQLKEDSYGTKNIIESIFTKNRSIHQNFHLVLQGTDFQIKVWQALVSVPEGETASYESIAYMIGKLKAVRAVANAIANNPIAYLIPCHRIICKSGKIHKYRWGIFLKKAILAYEGFESDDSILI